MTEYALPEQPLRIAVAQAEVVPGDVDANVRTAAELVREAAGQGARVVVFAEKFLSGYEIDLIRSDPHQHAVQAGGDERLAPLRDACRETGTVAVVGAAVHDGGVLRVSALVVGPDGRTIARYDKQTLFKHEQQVYEQGTAGCTLELDGGWRLGLGICYDSGFPEHARAAALDGCHAYLVGALFSVGNGYHESRIWFPARAFDNTVYAVLANHTGTTGGWDACGSSAVWGPDGRVVAEAGPDERRLLLADLDPERLRAARVAEPMLRDLHDTGSAPRGQHRVPTA